MIETSVDDVENGKSCRDSKRKEIFLQEAKQILSSKVSQSNKLSLDPVHHLPNYVVHVFQWYLKKKLNLGLISEVPLFYLLQKELQQRKIQKHKIPVLCQKTNKKTDK